MIFTILVSACSKDSLSTDNPDNSLFIELLNIISYETDGFVLIENFNGLNAQNSMYSAFTSIEGNRKPFDLNFSDKTISFGGFHYNSSSNRSSITISVPDAEYLFGKKFIPDLNIQSEEIIFTESIASQNFIYMPNEIDAQFENTENEMLTVESIITWNADFNNHDYFKIGLHYMPMNQSNTAIINDFPDSILELINIEDNGSYSLKAEDLNKFPDGATLSVYLMRTGQKIIQEGEMTYQVIGNSLYRADFEISL